MKYFFRTFAVAIAPPGEEAEAVMGLEVLDRLSDPDGCNPVTVIEFLAAGAEAPIPAQFEENLLTPAGIVRAYAEVAGHTKVLEYLDRRENGLLPEPDSTPAARLSLLTAKTPRGLPS